MPRGRSPVSAYPGEADQATRDGDRVLYILTNVPLRKASAKRVARLYRKRWTLETAFQHLEAYFHSEINTLGYPKAALFGFCLALVAYNMLAVVMAALRSVPGAKLIDRELSLYYVANDIAQTYHGMMIAIPEDEWRIFSRMRPAEMVATLRELAQKVCLQGLSQKSPGTKETPAETRGDCQASHVSTAKILRERKVNAATPNRAGTRASFIQIEQQEIGPRGHKHQVHRRAQRVPQLTP